LTQINYAVAIKFFAIDSRLDTADDQNREKSRIGRMTKSSRDALVTASPKDC
jgi:hypothetical protein